MHTSAPNSGNCLALQFLITSCESHLEGISVLNFFHGLGKGGKSSLLNTFNHSQVKAGKGYM